MPNFITEYKSARRKATCYGHLPSAITSFGPATAGFRNLVARTQRNGRLHGSNLLQLHLRAVGDEADLGAGDLRLCHGERERNLRGPILGSEGSSSEHDGEDGDLLHFDSPGWWCVSLTYRICFTSPPLMLKTL